MPTIDQSIALLREQIGRGELQSIQWPLEKLLKRHPDHPELISLAAIYQVRMSNNTGALAILRRGVQQLPRSPQLREDLAILLNASGDPADAEAHLHEAIRLDPDRISALETLSEYLFARTAWEECLPIAQRLIMLAPNQSEAWHKLGWIKLMMGLLEEADDALKKAIALGDVSNRASASRALLALYRDDLDPGDVSAIQRDWASRNAPPESPAPRKSSRAPGRIRIGYFSPDFVQHSVTYFFEPVLKHHDRRLFEIFCYSNNEMEDAVTARLRQSSDHWRAIFGIDDRDAVDIVRRDDLDILVDLAGHTAGNRLPLFTLKPAPVQASWLGYPHTTGLPQIDYLLTDTTCDPDERSQPFYSEKLERLPNTFFCYGGPGVNAPDPAPTPPLSRERGVITFAVVSIVPKIRPAMIRNWARILLRVPTSRLVLIGFGLETSKARQWISHEFVQAGVELGRIELRPPTIFANFLSLHDQWDVLLDTFPFNGHTTTCHGLWMGVPIVTLAGQMHASRMGASVLNSLALNDCIASSVDEYVEIAVKLAGDVDRRAQLRRDLRDRMRAAPMMNAPAFTKNLEILLTRLAGAAR